MSYTVLARRYRSATFDDVIGQEHVAQTLKKAIASNRVAHAYLFCGPRGTGKTSMARILAKALNCRSSKGPTTEPCNKCESCRAIARGDDMSVIEIDAASNTGVDSIREVIENAYTTAPGRFKIYIIDEVHMLSKSAFNALLKTLEEPPSHVKFILATTEPEKVLPTIISRCQRYDFRNIPTREIADHLKSICKQEKIKADDDALLIVAKAGAGSMRDALSLLDRMLSLGEKDLTAEMIEQLLGMPRTQVIFDLADAVSKGDVKDALQIADKLIARGLSSEALVAALVDHLRNLLVLRAVGADSDMIEVPGLSMDDLQRQAERFDTAALSQDIALLEELRRNFRTSQAGRALLDATLVRLTLADQFIAVATLLSNDDTTAPERSTAERRAASPVPPSTRTSPALKKNAEVVGPITTNVESVDPTDLAAVMSRLRSAVVRRSPGIDGFLSRGRFVGVNEGVAVIELSASAATMLDRGGRRDVIQDELSSLLNQPVGVKFQVDESIELEDRVAAPRRETVVRATPVPPSRVAETAAPAVRITPELREQLRNSEPLIKALMDEFGAEIVKVE